MSNTLSQMSTGLHQASWNSPQVSRNSDASAYGASQAGRGRTLSVSPQVEASSSHDVDLWANAVTAPLLEDAAA
jgi:hypothetical protein